MCRCRFPVLSFRFNKPDLGLVRLLLPLLGLSMVAGSSVLGGGQAARSVNLGLVPVLPWLVVPSVTCCRVAMVAALELQSMATKKSYAGNSCEPKDQSPEEFGQGVLKIEAGVVGRIHLMLAPALGAGCEFSLAPWWELATMPRQVQDHLADTSDSFAESLGLLLHISTGSMFQCGSNSCNFFPMSKDWNLSSITQWFTASFPLINNQFGIWLAAIGRTFFLLLQTWYNLDKFEKHISVLNMLWKIWLEKMVCKSYTRPFPIPTSCGVLLIIQVKGNSWDSDKFNHADYGMLLLHIEQTMMLHTMISDCGLVYYSSKIFESGHWAIVVAMLCLGMHCNNLKCVNRVNQVDQTVISLLDISVHARQRRLCCITIGTMAPEDIQYLHIISGSMSQSHEHDLLVSSTCTRLSLLVGRHVEDTVSLLFEMIHRKWTTTLLSLILRFNGKDILNLSSVLVQQNLQLSSAQPQVHTPDRPSGEPPAGHQLVWSMLEALEDCRCSNIGSVLSTDERSLLGSIDNLRFHLHEFRPLFSLFVYVGTYVHCSPQRSFVMCYSVL